MFWFLGHEGPGFLAPRSGIKPAAPALGGKVLTTGLLEKCPQLFLNAKSALEWTLKIIWIINSHEVIICKSNMVESKGHFQPNIQKYVPGAGLYNCTVEVMKNRGVTHVTSSYAELGRAMQLAKELAPIHQWMSRSLSRLMP